MVDDIVWTIEEDDGESHLLRAGEHFATFDAFNVLVNVDQHGGALQNEELARRVGRAAGILR